jgi:uncharacterized protein involved in outer membrane biogenesis
MNKFIKYGLLGIGSLLAIALLVVVYFAVTFNPNDYKQQVIDLVKTKKDRTLVIDGDIKLSYWPKIGADLGKISISEYKSDTVFASVNNVKVALAVMPLLKKELVVDTIYVDGANANVIKHKDGTFNFSDLLSKDDTKSEDIKFNVQGINITNSQVSYSDELANAQYAINQLNMQSGSIELAKAFDLKTDFKIKATQPMVDASVNLAGNFFADTENKHFVVKGLDSHITGDMMGGKSVDVVATGNVDAKPESMEVLVDNLKLVASGVFDGANNAIDLSAPALKVLNNEVSSQKITLSATQKKADSELKVNMVLADMKGSAKALQSSGITGDIAMTQGKRVVSGKFSSPFTGNIENLIFDIPKLAGNLDIQDPALPNGRVKGTFNVAAHTEVKKELANSQFNLQLDDTNLKGDINVVGFKKQAVKFNVSADKLNINKLMGKPKASATAKTSNKPADMSALKNMTLDGKINIGSIVYDNYHVSGLNVGVKADGDKLALNGLNVKVDDSQIKGNVGITHFAKPLYTFDLDIDQVNLDKYAAPSQTSETKSSDKPLDLSALKALNADGSLRIGHLNYGKTKASNLLIKLNANGEKLSLNPLNAKVDDSQINANLGVTQFSNPVFNFDVRVDKLDADRYITKSDQPTAKNSGDTPIDLSALKKLNAAGQAKIGWLKLANVKTENVDIGLKANGGQVNVQPFSANLYNGNMNGSLIVDARSTPSITFKQTMKHVAVGPLMVDAINNDMLSGTGTVIVDVSTQGNTVNNLKKALQGNASLNLADGALKGVDIAGGIRDLKSKINVFKDKNAAASDKTKKTDFSELTATFAIKNGVAHNDDLAMKAPILRLAKGDSKGDIDIGNQTINYTAKPTVVKSLKGQGGAELDSLEGVGIPLKISGTFSAPKFNLDYTAVAKGLAQSKVLEKVGGEKGAAVQDLINGDNKVDAIKGLLGKKKKSADTPATESSDGATSNAAPAEAPKSTKEQLKEEALKKLFKF